MRVLIIDGGPQGQNIARRLLARDEFRLVFRSAEHQVTFVERDEALCRRTGAAVQRTDLPGRRGQAGDPGAGWSRQRRRGHRGIR